MKAAVAGGPVRAAMLGTGAWARVLGHAASGCLQLRMTACWGRTLQRLEEFSAQTGIPGTTKLQHVLDDVTIEAVVIALPNDRHLEFAELAARHGKHVFVEKPIASSLDDGVAIARLERLYGVRVAVGHCARMLSGNRYLRGAISADALGRVSLIETRFSNDRGLRLTPQDWRWYQAGSPGGPLSQIAIHQFDTLRALGGDIAWVAAASARLSSAGAEVEDQWVVTVGFADGKLGNVVSSWTSPGAYSVRVTGDAASIYYEVDQALWSQPERLHENAVLERQSRGQGPGTRVSLPVSEGNMFRDELDAFALSVRAGAPCELSAENGCLALAAVDAAILSAHEGGCAVHIMDLLAAAEARNERSRHGDRRKSLAASGR